jgi:hypothetical protein
MQRFRAEPILDHLPQLAPDQPTIVVQVIEDQAHVLTWDKTSIYPRQTLRFDRMTPTEVATWLRQLANAIDSAAGRAQAGGGTAAAGSD